MSSSSDPELMQLFDFSVTDLTANREGKITAYQIDRLREHLDDNWFALGCLPVVGLMCYLCFIPMTIESPENATPYTIYFHIGVVLLIVVGSIVLCIGAIRRSSAEVRNPRIHSIQGQMRVYIKYLRPYEIGGAPFQVLQIGVLEFGLKQSQYKVLSDYVQKADEQKIYKLYYAGDSKTILSIEALS